ncbi:phage portal protein family protein [Limnovirga soli]|uniref:DUF935 family protein n=1 Tax=Limnovirga soli TaxID=2656915 RepID=A0A8J8FAL3_9BACT|nr:DUF935 family protein [Limnovirga soli]NNV54540.1 DUF935 family protein [Limnovirga soli]
MGLKQLLGFSKKEEAIDTQKQYWANFLAERNTKSSELKKVLFELVEQTKFLTKQDIAKWRSAWQRAISIEYPNRVDLLAVYRDIEIDNHLTGVIGQIKNEVLQKRFKVVDINNDSDLPDTHKQLEDAQWFIDFCELVIDSVFFGYSLIQFDDIIEINGKKKFACVELLEREHVIPEHHVFVKNQGDHWKQGMDYTLPPYNMWCIGIGKPKDLGLFNKIAPQALAKKNVLAFWDKFAELFGMPIRIGKTSSSNPKDRNEVAEMLQKMGAAAWGMFPDGTDIEIKETTRGDAYQVYDKRIDRANSEMSKAIVNQTMTTDNGSSKAQGEVHLEIQENVIEYFARLLKIVINDKLIPFMIMRGFKGWESAKFVFDETTEFTVDEQVKIEEMIMSNFDVDPNYFIEKYKIPVLGVKQKSNPNFPPVNNKGFFD